MKIAQTTRSHYDVAAAVNGRNNSFATEARVVDRIGSYDLPNLARSNLTL